MDIFSVFTLLGGLAFFLFGMSIMSTGLEKMVGSKLESVLKSMTSTRLKGLGLGCAITAVIQSSSAVTVMLVGLVNSGIMQLSQSIGVIMGSNIGTTATAWILSLAGIEGDNVFVKLLKPSSFSPLLALVGIGLFMMAKSPKKKDLGSIFLGFALLMSGMDMMSNAMKPLADVPEFQQMLVAFSNPLLGVLVGLVVTAIIQSSSASVGILASISLTGQLTFGTAIPIIMGQNIGTCVTALISSVGANKNAKRVTAVHISFNVIGTVVFLTLYLIIDKLFNLAFTDMAIDPVGVAIVHSTFNILTTAMLFPFGNALEKLASILIRDDNAKESFLDERLLNTPSFAITECYNLTVKMAKEAQDVMFSAISLLKNYDPKKAEAITEQEEIIDRYEDKLGTYLVKLSSKSLSQEDSNEVSELLHAIGDWERIGDHAVNIVRVATEIHEKKLKFSPKAEEEVTILTKAIKEILNLTVESFENKDTKLATKVEPLEQVIDGLKFELRKRHVRRLQEGTCTIEMGFVLSDLLTNYERVSDHCSNISATLIQIQEDSSMDTHGYLNEIKTAGTPEFTEAFNAYSETYALPASSHSGKG